MRIEHEGWTLFDYDVKMGRQVWYRDNDDGSRTWRTDYEVRDTIEANTAMRNEASKGFKGDWHKVASIPMGIYYDKLHEAVKQDDMAYVSRFLNDADNRAWRTKEGKV